ncbi:MAG TPA: glycerate kinase [Opitutales bacterium]|nr:glycerate kinase [Opitutales bacterium]
MHERFRGKRIVVAPDKFKGSLSAFEATKAIVEGIDAVAGGAEILASPIADGGEGTAEVLCNAFGGIWRTIPVKDPVGRTISARYCWAKSSQRSMAIFEMSEASGMWRLKLEELDPMRANTFGTGQMLREAVGTGVDRVMVGLGGSATNDAGIGMAAALGFRFLDRWNKELEPIPAELDKLDRIEAPGSLNFPEIIAAVDVANSLLGPNGATKVYGPQKGADPDQVMKLEANLTHLANIVKRDLGFSDFHREGTGAAGGLGFGLAAFCGAKFVPGFEVVAEAIQLEKKIASADLVITGEGKLDAQTLHGKGPAGVAKLAKKHRCPVIAFAGSVEDPKQFEGIFNAVIPIHRAPVELDFALKNAASLLRSSAEEAIKELFLNL